MIEAVNLRLLWTCISSVCVCVFEKERGERGKERGGGGERERERVALQAEKNMGEVAVEGEERVISIFHANVLMSSSSSKKELCICSHFHDGMPELSRNNS